MKELKLQDRIVIEICGNGDGEYYPDFIEKLLSQIAFRIRQGDKGGCLSFDSEFSPANTEVLWEHECPNYGCFRMGNSSLIRDAYYGAKEFFEVCALSKEDIEQAGFDASKLDAEDMERIASRQGDLISDCCDYWTALEGACEYWELPRKDDDLREVIQGTMDALDKLTIRKED